MSDEEKVRLTEEQKQLIKAALREFTDQVYRGIGKSVLEKIFWLAVGALMFWYFGGHLPK